MPIIPIMTMHKKITMKTLAIPPKDSRIAVTTTFIPLFLLINLKGLNILSILTILINPRFYPLRPISIIENNTIIKSNIIIRIWVLCLKVCLEDLGEFVHIPWAEIGFLNVEVPILQNIGPPDGGDNQKR